MLSATVVAAILTAQSPRDRIELRLTHAEARSILRNTTLNLPITGEPASRLITQLAIELKRHPEPARVAEPKRFHYEFVDIHDQLMVIDAWSLDDRFGSAWLARNRDKLREWVTLVNTGLVAPGLDKQVVYRWIPLDRDGR